MLIYILVQYCIIDEVNFNRNENNILDEVIKYSKQDAGYDSKMTNDEMKKIGQSIETIIAKWKYQQATKLSSLSDGIYIFYK